MDLTRFFIYENFNSFSIYLFALDFMIKFWSGEGGTKIWTEINIQNLAWEIYFFEKQKTVFGKNQKHVQIKKNIFEVFYKMYRFLYFLKEKHNWKKSILKGCENFKQFFFWISKIGQLVSEIKPHKQFESIKIIFVSRNLILIFIWR